MTGGGVDWGSTLCAALTDLREEGAFCDTTVVGNDQKTLRAHACVLAVASPTLKTYLKQAAGNTYIVRVDHMSSSTWQGVLRFVYTGQVVIMPGSSVASLAKAASTLQIRGLQTALLFRTKNGLKMAVAEKPVVGEKDMERPRVASLLYEEDRTAKALSSADDGSSTARGATTKKLVANRKRMRRRQPPAPGHQIPEAVDVTAIDGNIKSEHENYDDATQTGTTEITKSAAVIDGDIKSEHERGDDAIQTGTSKMTKSATAIDGDIKSEHESGVDAIHSGTREVNKSAAAIDGDIKSEHESGDDATHTCTNKVNKSVSAIDGGTKSESDDSATETEGASGVNKSARGRKKKPACLCNVCGKVLAPGSLARHMLYMHDDGEKPYRCDTCHMGFVALHALRKHSRVHTGEKPYRCHVCGKAFSSSATLPYHMKIHTGEKPYVCDICECAFRSQNAMTVHRRTHTGEKPYTCSVCGKSFVTANRRNRHAWMHEGRKPYHCDFCDKTYTSSTKLKVHRRIHTGEKPFMCELCGQLFSKQTSMKTHVASHNKLLQRGFCVQSLAQRGFCVQSLAQQKVQQVQVVLDTSEMCVAPVTDIE